MAWIQLRLSNYQQVAPLVRTGGSRHTGLAAPLHRNIHIVLDQGRIVQSGTHEELLQDTEGKYFALWNAQAQFFL